MSEFDQEKFKKKLKKKIAKKVGKYGKDGKGARAGKYANIQIGSKGSGPFYFLGFVGSAIYFVPCGRFQITWVLACRLR